MSGSLRRLSFGEVFSLAIGEQFPFFDPLALIHKCGHSLSGGGQCCGRTLIGPQSGEFKLVQVDSCASWSELIGKISKLGRLPESQWLEAYRLTYQSSDNCKHVSLPEILMKDPQGHEYYPNLVGKEYMEFCPLIPGRSVSGPLYRWLVRAD